MMIQWTGNGDAAVVFWTGGSVTIAKTGTNVPDEIANDLNTRYDPVIDVGP